VVLAVTALAALAAESVVRATPAGTAASSGAPTDMDSLLSPLQASQGAAGYSSRLRVDPLGASRPAQSQTVAPRAGVSTVNSAGRRGRSLTAILISDQRSVAVIDEAVVGVGDRLPDGARVDAIQSDRVVVVDRNGQRRVLTLTTGR
jgi:hypothetical protein